MMKQKHGFTLVELLMAMVVTTFLLGAIYLAVNTTQRDSYSIERKVVVQADAKSALDIMALEIGMASYNADPANVWRDPVNCNNLSTNQVRLGIQTATANTIVVQMDADDSCRTAPAAGCIGDGPNEIITYNYVIDDVPTGHITRTTMRVVGGGCTSSGAQPFLGGPIANPNLRNVRVNNDALSIPLFRYFDGQGNELASPLDNTTIPQIRRITITLAVQTDPDIAKPGNVSRQLFYSTSVIPRNHAIRD
jgi:prepilin-type N-terminal cleavage/methylation domain-containing protein